jgi:hypothetical protein
MGAGRCELARVGALVARIEVEILVCAELGRIDEDRHDDPVGAPQALGDELDMPVMQRPHGGNEPGAQALRPPRLHAPPQLLDGAHDGNAVGHGSPLLMAMGFALLNPSYGVPCMAAIIC